MKRLRGTRVMVELIDEDNKEIYEQKGGILMPKAKEDKFALKKGVILQVGHEVNTRDLHEDMIVYVKDFQGERLYPDKLVYIFEERSIVGND